MEKFRTLKKVTNLPKVVVPIYEPQKFMHYYDNGNTMLVTYYPKHNGKDNFITLQVWDKHKNKRFSKTITSYNFPEIVDLPKDNADFISNDFVLNCIYSCENNVCSLDFDNLNKDIIDYGCANGWPKDYDTPLITKYHKDIEDKPWLCIYSYEINMGCCWKETVNYTYGYKFNVDSSD